MENNTILAIDVGNSSLHWNFITNGKVDSYNRNKHTELSLLPWDEVTTKHCPVVIAGMLPHMNDAVQSIASDYNIKFYEINLSNQNLIKSTYPTLGIDRVCDLIGAINAFPSLNSPITVFDFGSATTITSCDKDGNFIGGIIKAGCEVETKGLANLTFSLPHVEFAKEQKISKLNLLSKTTEDSILHGIVIGQVALVEYYLTMLKKETSAKPKIIFTGGNASTIARFYKGYNLLDPYLTLKGIYHCYKSSLVTK
ncbi:MAG: type III pantothenate kinase [Candidatus Melainabacteria bacterium]|nr:type III pantothenate kinase [Candidatus Melainabacteria bacterium]